MTICLTCSRELVLTDGPGRPPTYCSVGCRRAAERELRRLDDALVFAEGRIRFTREQIAGATVASGTAASREKALEWWQAERQRLVERQSALLDTAPTSPKETP